MFRCLMRTCQITCICYEETEKAIVGNLEKPWRFLFTYSMEHSPSWEASRFSASQEIPLKVQCHIHKRPLLIPILKFLFTYHKMPTYITFSRLRSHNHFVFIHLQLYTKFEVSWQWHNTTIGSFKNGDNGHSPKEQPCSLCSALNKWRHDSSY